MKHIFLSKTFFTFILHNQFLCFLLELFFSFQIQFNSAGMHDYYKWVNKDVNILFKSYALFNFFIPTDT